MKINDDGEELLEAINEKSLFRLGNYLDNIKDTLDYFTALIETDVKDIDNLIGHQLEAGFISEYAEITLKYAIDFVSGKLSQGSYTPEQNAKFETIKKDLLQVLDHVVYLGAKVQDCLDKFAASEANEVRETALNELKAEAEKKPFLPLIQDALEQNEEIDDF